MQHAPPPLRATASIAFAVLAATLVLGCAPGNADERTDVIASALGQPLGGESEPNGGTLQATPITKDGVVRAHISPNGDNDFYSFPGVAGERFYATTMTGASVNGDTILELRAPDGTTVIETDDDDGTWINTASSIAGATLPTDGLYFLRMRPGSAVQQILPYDLHIKVQSGTPVPEVEPNDSVRNAQPLPVSHWVTGTMAAPNDVDFYSLNLSAGDTVFASVDLDPTRDGTEFDGRIGFGPFGTAFIENVDGLNTGPDSVTLLATVKSAGNYALYVSSVAGIGDYVLSVSVHSPVVTEICTTYASAPGSLVIPSGPAQLTSTITVPGTARVADVNVTLTYNHASSPDIDLALTSPGGTSVGLIVDVGSFGPVAVDMTLDEEAAFPAGLYPHMNNIALQPHPAFRLGWFDGVDAGGDWKLTIADDSSGFGGSFLGWSLTVCEAPPAPCGGAQPLFTAFSTDFESGPAGFTHSGTQDEWQLGTPSQGPFFNGCRSGTNCWKTDLDNTYNAGSNQNLVSPPINLIGVSPPIRLNWAMKYQLERADLDHGFVEVREVGGANPTRVFEHFGRTMRATIGNPAVTIETAAGWAVHTANLDKYAGKTVEVVFHVDSDATNQFAGMGVDDVSVVACPVVVCGDGAVQDGETCDDGNVISGDGCDSNCKLTGCGNGILTAGEACEDGNVISGDGCDSNCKVTGCGNGVVTVGELCDDGNSMNGDGCDSNCKVTACGNGIVTAGETCDDGNVISGDGCDANCKATGCGNGVVTVGELCDDGNSVDGDGCDDGPGGACTPSGCGNGVAAGGEGCDDGNLVDGDGCDSNCTTTGCGNGVKAGNEICDDGNATSGDGCDNNCTATGCGNGVQTVGETCDDGNATSGDGCDNNCTATGCGNGVQTVGELCDDGNGVNGDACDDNCTITGCGNGVKTGGEGCDDGNAVNGDGCDDNCTVSACGNGIAAPNEGCDDGNLVDGDGCDSNCTPTACGNGVQTAGEECDDGNVADGDGCSTHCTTEGSGGSGGSGGSPATSASGGTTGTAGTGGTTGTGGAGGAGGMTGTGGTTGSGGDFELDGGCGCRVPGGDSTEGPRSTGKPGVALTGLALALAGLARRRRKPQEKR